MHLLSLIVIVCHVIRLPKSSSSTSFKDNMKNFGNKLISLALNNNENMLIALTDTLQLVVYLVKGNTDNIKEEYVTFEIMFFFFDKYKTLIRRLSGFKALNFIISL